MKLKQLTISLYAIIITLFFGLAATSCNSDSGNNILDNMSADFVTFVSTDNNGSVFTFQKSGDSPLITLTAAIKVDTEQIKPGSRVILYYIPSGGQGAYKSGPVDVINIVRILNAGVEEASMETITSWGHDKLNVHTIARSGNYLDLWAEGFVSKEAKRFVLVADKATLADEYPALYLIFVTDDDLGRARQIYASFDLSSVWDLPTSKGVKLTYYTDGGAETMKLDKSDLGPLKPGGDTVE